MAEHGHQLNSRDERGSSNRRKKKTMADLTKVSDGFVASGYVRSHVAHLVGRFGLQLIKSVNGGFVVHGHVRINTTAEMNSLVGQLELVMDHADEGSIVRLDFVRPRGYETQDAAVWVATHEGRSLTFQHQWVLEEEI